MSASYLLAEAIGALRRNIPRTLLTMLGIIIGITSVILIISLGQGATASITEQISSFGTNLIIVTPGRREFGPARGAGAANTLTYEDARAIEKAHIPGVTSVSAQAGKRAQIISRGENVNALVYGVNPSYQTIQSFELAEGLFVGDDHIVGQARAVVIGSQVAKDLFGVGADPIGRTIKVDSRPFRVIGVLQTKGSSGFSNPDDGVFIPITTALKQLLGSNRVESIFIGTAKTEDVPVVSDQVDDLLYERHRTGDPEEKDYRLMSPQDAISIVGNVTGILTALLSAIAAISLVVGGIGIMNIMLVTVTERTREIGLLKAIGARRRDILAQFLIEAVVLTVSGGLIGTSLGIALDYLISSAIDLPFVVGVTAIVVAVGVSSLVGIVFGYYPARRAARLSPIDALKYE